MDKIDFEKGKKKFAKFQKESIERSSLLTKDLIEAFKEIRSLIESGDWTQVEKDLIALYEKTFKEKIEKKKRSVLNKLIVKERFRWIFDLLREMDYHKEKEDLAFFKITILDHFQILMNVDLYLKC